MSGGADRDRPAVEGQGVRDDHQAEMRLNADISRVLVVGLLAAVALLVVGAVLSAVQPGKAVIHASTVTKIPGQIAAGEASGFLQLGLIVLLLTPFARVLALGAVFAGRRQWLFVGISAIVAALLIVGASLGMSLG